MKPIPLRQATTSQLLEVVRERAIARPSTALGADPAEDLSTPGDWGTIQSWSNYAVDLLYAPGERFRHYVRSELEAAASQLGTFGRDAIERGAVTAGNVAVELGRRTGEAAAGLFTGLGDGFEKFWGFKPGEGLVGAAVLGLVALGAAVFVITTPGGQAILFGAGGGWGSVLSGVGASFPVLAQTVPAAVPATVRAAGDVVPLAVKALGVGL